MRELEWFFIRGREIKTLGEVSGLNNDLRKWLPSETSTGMGPHDIVRFHRFDIGNCTLNELRLSIDQVETSPAWILSGSGGIWSPPPPALFMTELFLFYDHELTIRGPDIFNRMGSDDGVIHDLAALRFPGC